MDLVILAAGMGSRFGGLKQMEPMDEYGNFIIDYSIFDAKRAGFDRVIFIIKEEMYEDFKKTIGKRIEDKIETHYAFQRLNDLPEGYALPEGRSKPWGTSQALLAAKDIIGDRFAMINADDFYGYDAFKVAADFLRSLPEGSKYSYGNVAYECSNTMTENGSVKRGVLSTDHNGELLDLQESSVSHKEGKVLVEPLDGSASFLVERNALVSMNFFCFSGEFLALLDEDFGPWIDANKDNPLKCEYLVPISVSSYVREKKVKVSVLHTDAVWYGMTYREDKPAVVASLKQMVDSGLYPKGLFQAK